MQTQCLSFDMIAFICCNLLEELYCAIDEHNLWAFALFSV